MVVVEFSGIFSNKLRFVGGKFKLEMLGSPFEINVEVVQFIGLVIHNILRCPGRKERDAIFDCKVILSNAFLYQSTFSGGIEGFSIQCWL